MPEIMITVRNKIAQVYGIPHIVCGNSDYSAIFDFDSEWDEYAEKTARFVYCDKQGARHWIDVPITNNTCNVPKLERVEMVKVGVYAGNIQTTSPAIIRCMQCITDFPSVDYDPSVDIYNQLMEQLAEALAPKER